VHKDENKYLMDRYYNKIQKALIKKNMREMRWKEFPRLEMSVCVCNV